MREIIAMMDLMTIMDMSLMMTGMMRIIILQRILRIMKRIPRNIRVVVQSRPWLISMYMSQRMQVV